MKSTHLSRLLFSGPIIPALSQTRYKTIRGKVCYGLAGLAMCAMLACGGGDKSGGDNVTGPVAPVNLTFSLQQVNGQNVPATFQPTDGKLVITSGTMLLRTDKTFSESMVYTFTPTGGAAQPDTATTTGTYAQTGADIVFTVPPAGTDPMYTFPGTISGNTLSYNDAGFVAVYQR